jgi:signal transduction histidine kinase
MFTTKPRGMGMGLPICRSIVEHHGGRIWVTSGHVRGTAFDVELPAAAPHDRRPRIEQPHANNV